MSVFASYTTATISPPFAPGVTATIRSLTGREVERAQAVHAASAIQGRGWAGKLQRVIDGAIRGEQATDDALVDPMNGYDRLTMCQAAITGWTFQQNGEPVPVTAATVADLKDDPLEWFATEILKLTKPHLFEAQSGDARKNV